MLNSKRLFITGTDTGIGKTLVSAILTLGLRATYWKPIQTGTEEGTDTKWLKTATQLPQHHFFPETYAYKAPLSPHIAAEMEAEAIDIKRCTLPKLSQSTPLIVEGAGGVLVPINSNALMVDLIAQIGLPALVVARSTLGTINHTLLTLEALRSRGIPIAGVVCNGPLNPENKLSIETYGRVRVLAEIPLLPSIDKTSLQHLFNSQFQHYFEAL